MPVCLGKMKLICMTFVVLLICTVQAFADTEYLCRHTDDIDLVEYEICMLVYRDGSAICKGVSRDASRYINKEVGDTSFWKLDEEIKDEVIERVKAWIYACKTTLERHGVK